MDEAQGTPSLADLRAEINTIDKQLLALFNQRARLAQRVGVLKEGDNNGITKATAHCPDREVQILRGISNDNLGPLSNSQVAHLFRELMSYCLLLQHPLHVAYLGPAGTFTHSAVLKHFGHAVRTVDLSSIDRVFRKVASGDCDYGVVPVENSTEGMVNHTLDMLAVSNLLICGEVTLPVHHHLLRKPGERNAAKRIYAHPQSFAQCRNWIDETLPELTRQAVSSNGEAARRASVESDCAAIASATAAAIYGLDIRERNIEDDPHNTTRFLIIGSRSVLPSGQDKTTILFSAPDRAGSLCQLLSCFSHHGVNMTRIESRPSHQGMWNYFFFADLEGHIEEPSVQQAAKKLQREAALYKWLGSYPAALP